MTPPPPPHHLAQAALLAEGTLLPLLKMILQRRMPLQLQPQLQLHLQVHHLQKMTPLSCSPPVGNMQHRVMAITEDCPGV